MTLQLHDVRDAEAFVVAIASRSQLELGLDDAEDFRQYLLAELWVLSTRFEPGGISFSSWAATTLRLRVVDWQRKRFGRRRWKFSGRTYERPRVELVSLDNDQLGDSLGSTLAGEDGGTAPVWDAVGRGLLDERDRERIRDLELLGLGPVG